MKNYLLLHILTLRILIGQVICLTLVLPVVQLLLFLGLQPSLAFAFLVTLVSQPLHLPGKPIHLASKSH